MEAALYMTRNVSLDAHVEWLLSVMWVVEIYINFTYDVVNRKFFYPPHLIFGGDGYMAGMENYAE